MVEAIGCGYIKKNGERCRAKAMWGSEPPRCIAHREDGGPTQPLFRKGNQFARLKVRHGFYRRVEGESLEVKTAAVLMVQEQLIGLIKGERSWLKLVNLYKLSALNIGRLLRLMERYEAETGQSADILLKVASGESKEKLRAEQAALAEGLKATVEPSYAKTEKRAPRYWLVYEFIVDYIRQYQVGPSQPEIKKGCGISSNHVLAYWLERLEQDGLIVRRRGVVRGIGLAR